MSPKEKHMLIEELTWKDARSAIVSSTKELAAIIDELSPDKNFPLFKVKYPFGSIITSGSNFYLPADNHQNSLELMVKNKLSYCAIPLGIIAKNCIELFFDTNRKIFSMALHGRGLRLGVSEHLGWNNQCTITSGARSLYMLPKISETIAHKQLRKKYEVAEFPPKYLYDHWKVFTQIAKSREFNSEWFCEVIFLSEEWIEKIKKDTAWNKFAMYIYKQGWEHSLYARKKVSLDIIWETFARSLTDKELRADPHVVDTLKHLIYIATGTVPASVPSAGLDDTGPLKALQLVYEDSKGYDLNEYVATIMHPQYFSPKKSSPPVYYSLQLSNIFESLPRAKKITSVIDNVRELSELLNRFADRKSLYDTPWLGTVIDNVPLSNFMNDIQINYFHGDMFAYGNLIKSSMKMPTYDSNLLYSPSQNTKRVFASNSTFLRGCVMISPNNQQKLL